MSCKAVNSGMSLHLGFLGASCPGHLNTWPLTGARRHCPSVIPACQEHPRAPFHRAEKSAAKQTSLSSSWQCFEKHRKFGVHVKQTQPFLYLFIVAVDVENIAKNLKFSGYLNTLLGGSWVFAAEIWVFAVVQLCVKGLWQKSADLWLCRQLCPQ